VATLAAARHSVLALSRAVRRGVAVIALRRRWSLAAGQVIRRSLAHKRRHLVALRPVVRCAREAVDDGINDLGRQAVVAEEDAREGGRIHLDILDRVLICRDCLHKSIEAARHRRPTLVGYNVGHAHIDILKLPEKAVGSLCNMEDVVVLLLGLVLDETDGEGDGHCVVQVVRGLGLSILGIIFFQHELGLFMISALIPKAFR